MTELVVDWCSYEAAKYAVEHWHYSKSMPAGKTVKIGIWENGEFIGSIVYSMGANKNIGKPYGLLQHQTCELTRVALTSHDNFVTKMIASSIKMLQKANGGLRLIVSYADANQGHLGKIYQASNWVYCGSVESDLGQMINGEVLHRRSVYSRYGRQDLEWLRDNVAPDAHYIKGLPKHKYLYPLDRAMRRQIEPLAQPYPKSCGRSGEGDTPDDQSGDAGSIPAVRSNVTGGVPELVE